MADSRTFARVRMHGWRNYQPQPYYEVNKLAAVVVSPVPVSTSYLLDALDNVLTDASGNRLTYP